MPSTFRTLRTAFGSRWFIAGFVFVPFITFNVCQPLFVRALLAQLYPGVERLLQ